MTFLGCQEFSIFLRFYAKVVKLISIWVMWHESNDTKKMVIWMINSEIRCVLEFPQIWGYIFDTPAFLH